MKVATNLILIKSIHTLIWIIFVVIIGFVLWSGISANISIYSWLCVGAVLMEVCVLAIFGGNCPLTKIAGDIQILSATTLTFICPRGLPNTINKFLDPCSSSDWF